MKGFKVHIQAINRKLKLDVWQNTGHLTIFQTNAKNKGRQQDI